MKKTLTIAAMSAMFAFGSQGATMLPELQNGLRYWWDFEGNNAQYINYVTGATGTWSENFGVVDNHGTLDTIKGGTKQKPWGKPDGVRSNSFTVSFDLSNCSSGNWKDLLCLTIEGDGAGGDIGNDQRSLHIEWNSSRWDVFAGEQYGGIAQRQRMEELGTWGRSSSVDMMTLTFDGSIMSFYANGGLVKSMAFSVVDAELVNLQFGGRTGNGGRDLGGTADIDNVGVWDHALTADQVQLLYNYTRGTLPIPEPMTATLMFLGLGGLLIRRR